MVVDKLNPGLKVGSFMNAIVAAIGIAVVTVLVDAGPGHLEDQIGGPGLMGAIVSLIVAALILMFVGKLLSGFETSGFTGALIAAIAIAVIYWLLVAFLGPVFAAPV